MNSPRLGIALSSLTMLAFCNLADAQQSDPATVEIFAAGSLRGVVSDLAAEAGPLLHIDVKGSFGGSGTMRERIEKGERPDLLLSADLGSPRKLEQAGRTVLPVLAFARNRMCVVSRRDAGLTSSNLVKRLLTPGVRVKTSTPVADPSGDYAWAMFDRIDHMQPGAGARLKEKAGALMNATATPADPQQSAAAALFASRQVDVSITYCSASASLEREMPELTSLAVPAALDPHPVYGIAVLSDRPAALKLALFLLSVKGQALIARNGLVPLLDPAAAPAP
ncbi:MAG TPA: substrate-binding domain-containing protein [Steroidobacteraceae bacterium]|nr:substrate-binding domain-containing protein [Steroidobacteraceae bacterium]